MGSRCDERGAGARRVPVPAHAGPEPWELAVTEQTVAVAAQGVTTVYRIADRKAVQQLDRSAHP
ncbi:hypothetical protein [Streptomyces xinghaiensis]|uniref:hypothetical protein n=1 Tax=Streptomyces xinghaiensis TaxID=1038928 RepID=UPI000593114F|nr:hypothetical protein [Streptomyces xinghaiensis]MZE77736.1 hypothetical protein [Streptomyces sp. SID5475]